MGDRLISLLPCRRVRSEKQTRFTFEIGWQQNQSLYQFAIDRQMRRLKSARQTQRFLSLQGVIQDLFRVGWHLLRSANYRLLRSRSLAVWRTLTAA